MGERFAFAAADRRHEAPGEHLQRPARAQAVLGQSFIEAIQVSGDGGGKAEQGKVAEEHSVSGF
jgi:hypothetical protein